MTKSAFAVACALGVLAPGGATADDRGADDASAQRYEVVGDAIPAPLGGARGDAARGRAIVVDRTLGMCLLCHSGPFPEQRSQGDLAPALDGAGARWSAGQLRLRIVDSRRLDPDSLMPSNHRIDGLRRVGAAWAGKPVLGAQQVEDVVAFLATLRGAPANVAGPQGRPQPPAAGAAQ